jgi:hypothetical protein
MDFELRDEQGYPWRASLTKKARCGMCENIRFNELECRLGHNLVYPLITGEHRCKDYKYKYELVILPPEGYIFISGVLLNSIFPECCDCAHNLLGRCDGVHCFPIMRINGNCEYFRSKCLICKNAIPMFQYGSYTRNNYCRLPPHLRDDPCKNGWKWLCPAANRAEAENMNCYSPMDVDDLQSGHVEVSTE